MFDDPQETTTPIETEEATDEVTDEGISEDEESDLGTGPKE